MLILTSGLHVNMHTYVYTPEHICTKIIKLKTKLFLNVQHRCMTQCDNKFISCYIERHTEHPSIKTWSAKNELILSKTASSEYAANPSLTDK